MFLKEIAKKKHNSYANLTVTINFNPKIKSIPKLTIKKSHFPNLKQINQLLNIYQKAKVVE